MNQFFIFPTIDGSFCIAENKGVICTVTSKGVTELNSFKLKSNVIPHINIWFLRGIEFLLFGTYYFFYGLKKSIELLSCNFEEIKLQTRLDKKNFAENSNTKEILKTKSHKKNESVLSIPIKQKKSVNRKISTNQKKSINKKDLANQKNSFNQNKSEGFSKAEIYSNRYFIIFATITIAFIFSIIILGLLPTHLGFWILSESNSIFLNKFSIALTKIIIFYLILILIQLVPTMKNLYKFNTAGNLVLNSEIIYKASVKDSSMFKTHPFKKIFEKKQIIDNEKKHRATNYLNFLISSLLLSYFMISLIGFDVSAWVRPFLNFFVMLICFSVLFELMLLLDTKWIKRKKYIKFLSWLVNSKPSQTEMILARASLCETEFMMQDNDRKLLNSSEIGDESVAFSFVYSEIKNKLIENNIDDISEVDWLIASYFNLPKYQIRFITEISKQQQKELSILLSRRIQGEPISKIFELTEFYDLKIKVNKSVLTPRQETEILTEIVIKDIKLIQNIEISKNLKKKRKETIDADKSMIDKKVNKKISNRIQKQDKLENNDNNIKVLDLCTGSGAIAIAIAKHTSTKVYATDISQHALEIAQNNARTNNVKIEFKQSDLFSNYKQKEFFDYIICNPPYIKTDDIKTLQIEVKNHDPLIALDGGIDGLYFYKKIASQASNYLTQNGKIFFEVGQGQAGKVKKLLTENFTNIKIMKDYNRIDRFVIAQKNEKQRRNKQKFLVNIGNSNISFKKKIPLNS